MVYLSEPLIWRKGFGSEPALTPAVLHHQMRLATQFAVFAAHNEALQTLQHEICRIAAEGLSVTFAKLLVFQSDERTFILEAGVGWRKGIVGTARLDADVGTAAGFAWHSGQSVISNDLVYERRFRLPAILAEHGIRRSINVVVPGALQAAFGVLEVESPEPGKFTEHDVFFLQLLAHSLASAIARSVQRTLYEEQAARSTIDHDASLHELHHRVRNDLQVICSVIASEARHTADPAGLTGFGRVGRRVMALGELYNHLLGQTETEEVDMGVYLRTLCEKIAETADLSSHGITLNTETERLMLPLDRAVKVAVAVNELVINAAKHAFLDGASGRITVGLIAKSSNDDDSPVVSIADDGCGFGDPRPGSAGLTFVKQLIHQAGGVLNREDSEGTRWSIRLPCSASKRS